jgi:hypothetical protein
MTWPFQRDKEITKPTSGDVECEVSNRRYFAALITNVKQQIQKVFFSNLYALAILFRIDNSCAQHVAQW